VSATIALETDPEAKAKPITPNNSASNNPILPTNAMSEQLIADLFPLRKIKRVLLVVPPDMPSALFKYEQANERRYPNFPPYGFLVLAQHLAKINIECQIINLHHIVLKRAMDSENEESFDFSKTCNKALDEAIKGNKPDLIGFTCMFTNTHESLREVATYSKKYDVPIAAGGVHVSNDPQKIFSEIPAIDMVFRQEAEVSFREFINVVNQKNTIQDLAQLMIKSNGFLYKFDKEDMPQEQDLNVLPAYDLISIEEYEKYGAIGSFSHLLPKGTKMSTALSNRGCRARCTFCSVRYFSGLKVRQRSVDSVVDELQMINERYGVEHIMWLDDDLFKNEKRTIKLFNEIVRRNLNITWDATNGVIAASCTDEIIAAAAESGCIGLHIGIESGNPDILLKIRKPGTVDTFLAAAEIFRKYEQIVASAFIMIGFPHETMGQIWDTINLCRQMDLDWYSIGTLQPLPGTPIYDSMIEEGLIGHEKDEDRRFVLGPNGRAKEKVTTENKHNDINLIPPEYVPSESDLTDIWFYMDYHLNYHRLFNEKRPVKIEQQMKQLKKVSDSLYKDHAFALYFLAHLQRRKNGYIDSSITTRLTNKLNESDYWLNQFGSYGLSLKDFP